MAHVTGTTPGSDPVEDTAPAYFLLLSFAISTRATRIEEETQELLVLTTLYCPLILITEHDLSHPPSILD